MHSYLLPDCSIFLALAYIDSHRPTVLFVCSPTMSLHPYLTPFFLVDGSPTEGGSDSTKNQDAQTSYISVPPELPAPVVDIVRSQKNAYPVFYYNCSMDPVTEGNIQGAYSSSQPAGRWTYNNLPEMGIMPYKFQPLLKQDASSAKTKSEKSVIQKESSCCLHQKYVLAAHII